jgi:threonylcarbamoyladenosine tRNA methylthiotransferase MtaB
MAGVAAVIGNSHKAFAPAIALGLAESSGSLELADESASNAPAGLPSDLVSLQSLLRDTATGSAPIWVDDRFAHSFIEEAQLMPGAQTRPNLKIQEGCGNRCTFCVIPQTRGSSRSLPTEAILQQAERFVAAGGNELVLSGINLGRWGHDLPVAEDWFSGVSAFPSFPQKAAERMGHPALSRGQERPTLASLVRQIFSETALPRLRLSSIEPMDWNREMIALMAEFGGTRLARHAHLPLQSGSDAVLRRMHRRYRPWHYAEKVSLLMKAAGPHLTLGADVMVGFPGETDAEFEETLEMVRALPFGYLHLFPFSPRPGTRAWSLHAEQPVASEAVDERMAQLRTLAMEKSKAHRRNFIGMELDAITLHTPATLSSIGRTSALSENFLPLEFVGHFAANRMLRARVTAVNCDGALEATDTLDPVGAGAPS